MIFAKLEYRFSEIDFCFCKVRISTIHLMRNKQRSTCIIITHAHSGYWLAMCVVEMANLGRIYIPPQLDKARNAISYLSSLSLPSSSASSASSANAAPTDLATSTGPTSVPATPPEGQDSSSSQGKINYPWSIVITVKKFCYVQGAKVRAISFI